MQEITYLGEKYSNEKSERSFRMSSQVSECEGEFILLVSFQKYCQDPDLALIDNVF